MEVPKLKPEQAKNILAPPKPEPIPVFVELGRAGARVARFVTQAALIVAAIWLSYQGSQFVVSKYGPPAAKQTLQQTGSSTQASTASGGAQGGASQAQGGQQTQGQQSGVKLPQYGAGALPKPGLGLRLTPFYLLFGGLLALAWSGLHRKPEIESHDSPPFTKALEIWSPVVILKGDTPRAMKRFVNRVRYLAMREDARPEVRSVLHRWGQVLKQRWPDFFGKPDAPVGAPPRIPDEIFVAMTAMDTAAVSADAATEEARKNRANQYEEAFESSVTEHNKIFHKLPESWDEDLQYEELRRRFLQLSAEITTR